MDKGDGNLEDAAVKMEHAHVDDGDGSDAFQYMSQECCGSADFPAKPSKKTTKVASSSSSTRKSLSGTTLKDKAMKTAVSVNKSGSASPRVFHLAIEPRLISASWPPALFHETAACADGAARHNTCFY